MSEGRGRKSDEDQNKKEGHEHVSSLSEIRIALEPREEYRDSFRKSSAMPGGFDVVKPDFDCAILHLEVIEAFQSEHAATCQNHLFLEQVKGYAKALEKSTWSLMTKGQVIEYCALGENGDGIG